MENRPSGQRRITLRLDLLGGFAARDNEGRKIAIGSRKGQALLAFLALQPGKPQPREKVMSLLWSDSGEPQARSSLRQALTELRKALVDLDPPPLITDRDTVHIDPDAVEVDAVTFDRLVDEDTPGELARAVELYRGDLLDGLAVHDTEFEAWLRIERERLRARASLAFENLLERQTGNDAIATGRRLLALDPLKEATHRALIRLYTEVGDRNMAIKQYNACCEVLQAELGLMPEIETQQLAEEIQRGEAKKADSTSISIPAETPKAATEPPPLPDKPSIAVLPFVNMSGDPEQEYFSDGITEDIITELSRFRSLFVIARNSSFSFKGQAVDVIEVGKRLGVRFVVEGSVRKAGNRVRVTAQLVEAATGDHLWAERYDRDLEDVFAVQDEVVRTITSTVGGRIESASQKRAERLSASDLQAYDHIHRATASINRWTKEGNAWAREHLERAVELDPRSSQVHHQLSVVHFMDWMAHWVDDREKSLAIAYECAKKAVALDDTDGMAYSALGMCHIYHREFDDARHCFERALMLNPNDCHSRSRFGFYLTVVGRIDEALTNFDQSARINPLQPERVDWMRGITFFTARRYDEAIVSLRAIKDPINEVRGWLAVSYAGAGRLDEARAMLEEFLRVAEDDMAVFPGRKLAAWEPFWHGAIEYQSDADFEHLYDALRKAGLED
jgi:TolB-like protein/Flp pilus assembly protein TadD